MQQNFSKFSPKNLNFVLIKLLCSIKYTYEVSDFSLPLCAPRLQDCHVLSIKVGTHTRQSQGCKSGSGSITAAMHTDTGTYRSFNTVVKHITNKLLPQKQYFQNLATQAGNRYRKERYRRNVTSLIIGHLVLGLLYVNNLFNHKS
jgi:hypothetical protein